MGPQFLIVSKGLDTEPTTLRLWTGRRGHLLLRMGFSLATCWSWVLVLKCTPSNDASWPENAEKRATISICRLRLVAVSICNRSTFYVLTINSSVWGHVGSPFSSEEQRKAGSWCNVHFCQTCWPWSCCHMHRKLDTKCWSSWPCFCFFQRFIFNKLDCNLTDVQLSFFSCQ